MTRHNKKRAPARLLRSLYVWHRWIGLAAALFVIMLSITGLLLNHTEELALDRRPVTAPALLDWYGIHAPAQFRAYRAGPALVAELDGRLFFNQSRVPGSAGRLTGALPYRDMIVVAQGPQVLLLTGTGELIERLESPGSEPGAIGLDDRQRLWLRTARGLFLGDGELLHWEAATEAPADTAWSVPGQPTASESAALVAAWRGDGLPLERVLLDLHSGRILGRAGVYLMDAAAVVFLLLAASGIWLWARRRASARAHARKVGSRDDSAENA